ncbi:MAG: acyl-CoA dehydrogenase [Gammaproteobacteria bacterium]|jgi:acyl-CoA dehydrogenase
MSSFFIALISVALLMLASYQSWSLTATAMIAAGATLVSLLFGGGFILTLLLVLLAFGLFFLSVEKWRIGKLSKPLFSWYRKAMPAISQTEQEAIDAGTVWWDGELFSGKPQWGKLLSLPKPSFTKEEQAFIDGPLHTLCRMVNNWEINHHTTVIPDEVTQYIKEQGFLGMIIPKKYGGLEFSGMAQTEILSILASTGGCVSNYVNVPNSLGPGELLLKYGTQQQKSYYLPRLATGDELPCFALTGPLAGSDATSLPDYGVVCKKRVGSKTVLGIKLTFNKRYITLAPVATLIGLAFRLEDPDHLMGEVDDYGITCALIPRDTKGIKIGRRHKPIGDAFLNGPIQGDEVFVPLEAIIGGPEMAGKGWTMLVNCLSVGRCITLPSVSNSLAKHLLLGTSAYAALRQQFGLPISRFEGVQKPLARMAGLSYIINATRLHTAQSLSYGEKPSVASAILKYHLTEMARQCTLDAMDIQGGKAIMMGPKNYVADAYSSIPIAITVEGANIMTRNLMIFGQGAIRSHPYVLKEMVLAGKEMSDSAVAEFDDVFFGHVGFTVSNAVRAFTMALSGSRIATAPNGGSFAQYYKDINRLSAAFALTADITMLTMQSKLKFKEMLSARLGDLLSNLYLASMVLKHHESEGAPIEDEPLVRWCLDYLLHNYQIAMQEILQNYPNKAIASVLKGLVFPLGAHFAAPTDKDETAVSQLMTTDSSTRQRLLSGTFTDDLVTNPVGNVNAVFLSRLALNSSYEKIKLATKQGTITKALGKQQILLAQAGGVVDEAEAKILLDFDKRLMAVINVDDFDPQALIRDAV